MFVLKAFSLLEIFWDYDIIVTKDMPSLGYYSALGLYSAGKSRSKLLNVELASGANAMNAMAKF